MTLIRGFDPMTRLTSIHFGDPPWIGVYTEMSSGSSFVDALGSTVVTYTARDGQQVPGGNIIPFESVYPKIITPRDVSKKTFSVGRDNNDDNIQYSNHQTACRVSFCRATIFGIDGTLTMTRQNNNTGIGGMIVVSKQGMIGLRGFLGNNSFGFPFPLVEEDTATVLVTGPGPSDPATKTINFHVDIDDLSIDVLNP